MTALFSAINFALENEAKLNNSVNFCRPTPQQKMFYVPIPYLKRLFCFWNWSYIEKKGRVWKQDG